MIEKLVQLFVARLHRWLSDREKARAEAVLGAARSPQWARVRREFIKENPTCRVCGTKNDLDIHHCVPFHLDPSRELDPDNLITLCRPHHLLFGHLMSWRSHWIDVKYSASEWNERIILRP